MIELRFWLLRWPCRLPIPKVVCHARLLIASAVLVVLLSMLLPVNGEEHLSEGHIRFELTYDSEIGSLRQ